MTKAKYKGNHLPLQANKTYDVKIIYDDDCGYVDLYVYSSEGYIKCMYDGRKEMKKEWEMI